MKVILIKDVPGLGNKDAVVDVADGHARNYLIPRGMALEATSGRLGDIARRSRQVTQKKAEEEAKARSLAARLAGTRFVVAARTGEGGKLFGSVTSKEVAAAIAEQHGIKLDRRKIHLASPIKSVGEYQVAIRLYPEVHVEVSLEVRPDRI